MQLNLVADWGIEIPAGRGNGSEPCVFVELDRRGLRRVASYLGKDGGPLLDRLREIRLVMSGGRIVTVMHRFTRARKKNRPWREERLAS